MDLQVYKGRLRATGEEVAVKVQRPNISENIAIDMVLLRRFMTLVDAQLPSLIDVWALASRLHLMQISKSTPSLIFKEHYETPKLIKAQRC